MDEILLVNDQLLSELIFICLQSCWKYFFSALDVLFSILYNLTDCSRPGFLIKSVLDVLLNTFVMIGELIHQFLMFDDFFEQISKFELSLIFNYS